MAERALPGWFVPLLGPGQRRPALRVYYEALVSEFDVGRYAALLRADATLSLDTTPPGAIVTDD